MKIKVKYCGGCNPRYDRVAFVSRLQETFGMESFALAEGEQADVAVVMCGCSAACADISDCSTPHGRFVLWDPGAWDELCAFLNREE